MTERRDSADELDVERIAAVLRPMPRVDPEAQARVLVAVAAERGRDALRRRTRGRRRRVMLAGAIAASLVVGLVAIGRDRHDQAPVVASRVMPSTPATLTSDGGESALVPVQLVVRAPGAHRVAVVGDFTGWDDARVPMQHDAASGLWSATVSVKPGRHVYAYVADDTLWMRDPRAPVANDDDFGRPGSLLLVGRP